MTLGAPRSVSPNWTTVGGTWSISSNAARPDGAGARYAILDIDQELGVVSGVPGKDMNAKLTLEGLLDAGSTFVAGIAYRSNVGATNLFRAEIDRATRRLQLVRRVASVDTVVSWVPWFMESAAEIRVMVQGTRHRIYLNGRGIAVIDTVEDRGLLTGSFVGIYGANAQAGVLYRRFAAVGLN